MRYSGLVKNDFANGKGVCVSLFTQGCPHRCKGCFNPETWDYDGGKEVPADLSQQIIQAISANGIQRNFSILGGEPLCPENREFVNNIINKVKQNYPTIKIFIWTGYTLEDLQKENNPIINSILSNIDTLIDGPYVDELRDLTLELRGSKNQKIRHNGIDF